MIPVERLVQLQPLAGYPKLLSWLINPDTMAKQNSRSIGGQETNMVVSTDSYHYITVIVTNKLGIGTRVIEWSEWVKIGKEKMHLGDSYLTLDQESWYH